MKIGVVNGFMYTSRTNEKKRGNEALKEVDTAIYNGVDIKKVKNGSVRRKQQCRKNGK